MGKFQLLILLSVVTCAIISTVESVPVKDSSIEKQNADKCKQLCGFCGCTGYFCGDECLCECNSQTDGEAECVDTMKSNCKKLELPFEVLIQGPNVNRMVRSLLYADPNEESCLQSSESNQKKRSTISIYKPDGVQQQDEVLSAPAAPTVDIPSDVHHDDSPIHINVAQKLDSKVAPVKVESEESADKVMENLPSDIKSNVERENQELALPKDDVDRINTKRHIVDINQDIDEYMRDLEDSFLYKRDTEGEVEGEKKEEVKDEDVGSAAPVVPAPVPAAAAPLLPKVREAIKHITSQIPTTVEIRTAWEGIQKDFNVKVNAAIAEARTRAAELRTKVIATPVPSPEPAVVKPLTIPVPVAPAPVPAKFNPFLLSENEESDVGTPLLPVVPVVPVVPNIPVITLPIQAEIAKTIATFRASNKIIHDAARIEAKDVISNLSKSWLIPHMLLGATQEEGEVKKDEGEKKEEEKVEEKNEENKEE